MRYQIYFEGQGSVEVDAYDLRVVGSRRLEAQADSSRATRTVDLEFASPFELIVDDHNRTIFQR
jgi:hypothetical protein